PAVNAKALAAARSVLVRLRDVGILPLRVMPSVEGGVVFVLAAPPRYADIECFNNGKVMIGLSPDDDDSRVVEVTRSSLIREVPRLRAFIQTYDSETDVEGGSEG
ncbi:MAG: hypothetical protein WD768_05835, partial [Phycisphaeraceae bacterium]